MYWLPHEGKVGKLLLILVNHFDYGMQHNTLTNTGDLARNMVLMLARPRQPSCYTEVTALSTE